MKSKDKNNIDNTQTTLNLFSIQNKPIELSYTGEKISSDGGLLLLKETENQINIIKKFSDCIEDQRDHRYIDHTIESLVSQRVYQIASGYQDANDCNLLRKDAIIKVCSVQLPETGLDLGSQPTMSRFKNSTRRSELYQIAKMFVLNFITSYESEPPVIIIDPDDTNHTAYGKQLQIEFNNYYGDYVFMPLHIYEGFSGKLITTILKPGRSSKNVDVFAVLKRIIELLRKSWKNTVIVVRGDSHFHCPELTSYSKKDGKIITITGLAGNSRLNKLSEVTVQSAKKKYERTKEPVKMYHTFAYKAQGWEEEERVIVKVEVTQMGTNIRYIATNNWEYRTRQMYEMGYCARGAMELRIKDHKTYLKSDRSSCNQFEANQLRLFLHSVAYVLIHTLQKEVLKGTEFANATMQTIQLKLIKTAARVKQLKTKLKIEFPRTCPAREIQTRSFDIFEVLRC